LSAEDDYYNIPSVAQTIQKLACINKYFYSFYNNEDKIKEIISFIVPHQYRINSHHGIAIRLNKNGICQIVANRIKRLFDIVIDPNKKLKEEDLQDYWYNNSTCSLTHYDITKKKYPNKHYVGDKQMHTLLSVAIEIKNFTKIQQLLTTNIVFNPINSIIFNKLAQKRTNEKENKVFYLTIIQLLLAKGLGQEMVDRYLPTTLLYTVMNDDEEYTFLLLKYGVSPYGIPDHENLLIDLGTDGCFDGYYETKSNVIDIIGNSKPWFTDMINNRY
jgi:hypothetical protein